MKMRANVARLLEAQENEPVLIQTTHPVSELEPEKQTTMAWKSIWSTLAETPGSMQKHRKQK